MRVLVIGGAGRTGRAVVEQAVAAGHDVTAFVRKVNEYKGPDVRVIEGDAADRAKMDAAVRGQDAVLDTVGGKTPYKATTLEASIANTIVASMQRNGVRRLVVTSMLGEGDSKANTPIYDRLLLATFLRGADKDKAAMEAAVEGATWTGSSFARLFSATTPPRAMSAFSDAGTGEKAHKITRADLAAFMVTQLSSDEHLHRTVTIAND